MSIWKAISWLGSSPRYELVDGKLVHTGSFTEYRFSHPLDGLKYYLGERFPFIEAMLTPIGILGGIRGVFFGNIGGANFDGQPFKVFSRNSELVQPITGYTTSPTGGPGAPIRGPAQLVSGFRLVDARASYGVGLETFAIGFPIHFDWAWRTLFNKDWEDLKKQVEEGAS